jgi:hypothetical protein
MCQGHYAVGQETGLWGPQARFEPVFMVMTVEAGRVRGGMAKVGIEFSLSEPTSLLVEW